MLNRQKFETIETGLYAMDLFAKEIAIRIDKGGDSIYSWMEKSYEQMAFIGPQRIVLAQTLWLVAARERSEIIGDWAQAFHRLGQSWEVTRNMFFKAFKKKMLLYCRVSANALTSYWQMSANRHSCYETR